MGLFDSIKDIFKNNLSTKDQTNMDKLSVAEITFLEYADGHDSDLNTFSQHYKYHYDLNYEKNIQKFLSSGLLLIESGKDAVQLYKISDLKTFLKMHGLPVSGKKEDLINRIIANTTDYTNYFTKRIFLLTDKGKEIVEQYRQERIRNFRDIIEKATPYIRNQQFHNIIPLFESDANPDNPLSLPHTKEAIFKEANAISEYIQLGHNTDREIAICIASLLFKYSFPTIQKMLNYIGYPDIQEQEIHTASTALHSLSELIDFRQVGIKRYKISSCGDSRTCEKCRKMDNKIYSVSEGVIGKTLPPFCDNCRCIIRAQFEIGDL